MTMYPLTAAFLPSLRLAQKLQTMSTTITNPTPANPSWFLLDPTTISSPTAKSTALHNVGASAVEMAALGFFHSIRIPAALLAGSSLSALFAAVGKDTSGNKTSKTRKALTVCYHVFALVSLLLSLNVIITSTAAGTMILLSDKQTAATSAFAFLKEQLYFEFLITRWSFFMSLFHFIASLTLRVLLEFDLTRKSRRKEAATLLFFVGALVTHAISFLNGKLYSSSNLLAMTLTVVKYYCQESIRKPLGLVSILMFAAGCATGLKTILESYASSKKSSSSSSQFLEGFQLMIRGARDGDQETLAKGRLLVQKGLDEDSGTETRQTFIEDTSVAFVSDEGNESGESGLL